MIKYKNPPPPWKAKWRIVWSSVYNSQTKYKCMKNNKVKKCFMLFKHQFDSHWKMFFQCRILSVIIMLMCVCGISAQSINDEITFELNNQSLERGLQQVAKLSGFHVSYAVPLVSKYKTISIPKGTRSVGKTLDLLLADTDL